MKDKASLITGSVYKKILIFALPILFSRVFQTLYNIVDSLVVGNYVGTQALAAISSSSSLTFLLIGFFMGTFSGAGVVIAKNYGAGDKEMVSRSVHTALFIGIFFGVFLTVVGVIATPTVLRWMNTPDSVLPDAIAYMRFYFAGVSAMVLYNCANSILQAVGNSKLPLYYLILSSLVNIGLDFILVVGFHTGVIGAALATVIAQGLSAFLAYYHLSHVDDCYRISLKNMHYDKEIGKEMLTYGLPAGVQNSVISIGNVAVQTNINKFGEAAMAGNGAFTRISSLAFIPITSFSLAMTTFIGQNLGAREYGRAKKGARFSIIITITLAELIGVFLYVFSPQLVGLFDNNPEVIQYGILRAQTVSLFLFLMAFSHASAGILRGSGKSIIPMYVMLGFWCIFRVIYVNIITTVAFNIQYVFMAYPISWACSATVFLIYLKRSNWLHGLDSRNT